MKHIAKTRCAAVATLGVDGATLVEADQMERVLADVDGSDDLTSIALDAGFASHSHFTARFRAFVGVTPPST
jgi:AraC-like DNA-binding protein